MLQPLFKFMGSGLLAITLLATACNPDDPVGPPTGGTPSPQLGGKPGGGGEEAPDRMTGGGKLGDGRDFATFGFTVRSGQGEVQWVQHCLDGVTGGSTCVFGGFTFHASTVTSYATVPEDPVHCRTWTGTGEVKLRDPAMAAQYNGTYEYRVDHACDFGEPGHDRDLMSITIAGSYHRDGSLTGGNIQLHADKSNGPAATIAVQGGQS